MKKIIFLISLSFGTPLLAFAENTLRPTITSDTDLISKINYISNVVFSVLIAVALLMIVVAAFNFLTAAGNAEKVGSAKKMLLYAIIAVIIAVVSRGIVKVVASLVGGSVDV